MKVSRVFGTVLIPIFLLTGCGKKDNKLYFSQPANGSRGQSWKYEIDPEGVLKEVDFYESYIPPIAKCENWTFEPIGQGEVTISWICFVSGTSIDEKECYSVKYRVDENLKAKKISDSREADVEAASA